MSDTNARSGGIGFCGTLTIVFIVLRLTDVIDWEWWWVLAPLWVPITATCVFVAKSVLELYLIVRYQREM